jgi:short-subunit dehydrogenase
LNGEVAAVLGVGLGLGAAIARRFASEGFAVVLMDRNEGGLSEIQREIEDGGAQQV